MRQYLLGTCSLALLGSLGQQGPSAAQQKLAYFLGDWAIETHMLPGPWGPGGKSTGRDQCEWMEGRYFVVCHTDLKTPHGAVKGLGVLGYDSTSHTYTRYAFHNDGSSAADSGTLTDSSWVFTSTRGTGESSVSSRTTFSFLSKDRYTFRIEVSRGGGRWAPVIEGGAAKR